VTGYIHRDPRRVSGARLAELAEHDARYITPDKPSPTPPGAAVRVQSARRRADFAALRELGLSVADAATAVGVGPKAARRYELARLEQVTADA
jgi:hypothetical protein